MNEKDKINISDFFEILVENEVKMETVPPEQRTIYVDPDDDFDFHSYRILLLVYICGTTRDGFFTTPTIYGRRKFSFYDFLIRYPFYLVKVIEKSKKPYLLSLINLKDYEKAEAFSPMVRYIRGPWDHRYDAFFNYMISKKLIEVKYDYYSKTLKAFSISLTPFGMTKAEEIKGIELEWTARMEAISEIFSEKTTNDYIEKYIEKEFPALILGCYGVSENVY